jgi:hypothetical protein
MAASGAKAPSEKKQRSHRLATRPGRSPRGAE